MREFLRSTKKIRAAVARGESFEVLDRTTPIFRIMPVLDQPKKKYTFEDLEKFTFNSGKKTLSQDIDKIVYGI